jgi:hypothetical protein
LFRVTQHAVHKQTVDGDWITAICDDCYADLHPGITVTVKFFSARFGRGEPFAVIRQREPWVTSAYPR